MPAAAGASCSPCVPTRALSATARPRGAARRRTDAACPASASATRRRMPAYRRPMTTRVPCTAAARTRAKAAAVDESRARSELGALTWAELRAAAWIGGIETDGKTQGEIVDELIAWPPPAIAGDRMRGCE